MTTQPGWYQDPDYAALQRYWDGQGWTEQRQAAPFVPVATAPQTSTLAVVALIAAFFVPVLGLILGYVARKDIRQSNGTKTGDGLALAAIIIGWIVLAIVAVFLIIPIVVFLLGGQTKSAFESTQESIGFILRLA